MRDKNVLRGWQNQKSGTDFEGKFYAACYVKGIAITRVPDGCRQAGPHKIVRVKSPFDWIISYNGKTALIDTKSTSRPLANSAIDQNQVSEMMKHWGRGVRAGYVVWFREEDRVMFIPADVLDRRRRKRGSIEYDDPECVSLGEMATGIDPMTIFAFDPWFQGR